MAQAPQAAVSSPTKPRLWTSESAFRNSLSPPETMVSAMKRSDFFASS